MTTRNTMPGFIHNRNADSGFTLNFHELQNKFGRGAPRSATAGALPPSELVLVKVTRLIKLSQYRNAENLDPASQPVDNPPKFRPFTGNSRYARPTHYHRTTPAQHSFLTQF